MMLPAESQATPALSSSYVRLLLQLGLRWGLSEADMMSGTGIAMHGGPGSPRQISPVQKLQLLQNIVRLSGRADLGFAFGINCRMVAHGPVICAAMCSATLQDALDIIVGHGWGWQEGLLINAREDKDSLTISLTGKPVDGPLGEIVTEAALTTLYRLICFLLGEQSLPAVELHLPWPEPAYFEDYRHLLPSVCWAQSGNGVRIPRALLSEDLVTANPPALLQAIRLIEQEEALRGRGPEAIAARICAIVRPQLHERCTLTWVASRMSISASTLKRRLRAGGCTYQGILDEIRMEEACRLMKNPTLPLQEISRLLGFSDQAAFTKAFRRWYGITPSVAREQLQ
jgi:AraC-like DNA-binding protein